ncbi:MAG: tetratricopeptide repeat protein [Gammaproteobacteria bacterium]|nr:tetratricopeptide repeat protein [Gammaproteobacteria bacterium]
MKVYRPYHVMVVAALLSAYDFASPGMNGQSSTSWFQSLVSTAAAATAFAAADGAATPLSLTGKRAYSGSNPHAELTPDQHLMVALRHHAEGRLAQAMDTLDRAIEKHAMDAALLGVRGSFYLEQGAVTAALSDLEKAVSLDPYNAGHRVNRAQVYRRFNRLDEALADLDKAVDLEPNSIAARFNRGVMLYAKARYDAALADFEHCISLQPNTAGPYFNRGVTLDALGNRPGAIADLEHFIELTNDENWTKAAQDQLDTWRKQLAKAESPEQPTAVDN